MPYYKIVVHGENGQLEEFPRYLIYQEVAALTERVVTALQTDKAISAFSELSKKWKLEHGAEFDVGTSVDAFQDILKDAITQPDLWPAIIVDFQMPKCDYSFFEPHEDSEEAFDIRKQRIRLNGLRVDMLRIDRYDGNPEWYPRWLEMFASYCHEVAHMFIAYLSLHYTGGLDCRSPVFSLIDFQPNPRESGFFLEQYIFGGILWRGRDTSGLGSQLMPGVPVYEVGRFQFRGIPLKKVLNIANRPPGEPYTSSDFDLELYRPRGEPRSQENPELDLDPSFPLLVHFGRWWEEYEAQFGIEFAKPRTTY